MVARRGVNGVVQAAQGHDSHYRGTKRAGAISDVKEARAISRILELARERGYSIQPVRLVCSSASHMADQPLNFLLLLSECITAVSGR